MKTHFTLLVLLFSFQCLFAQNPPRCSGFEQEIQQYRQKQKSDQNIARKGGKVFIPLTFHIVTETPNIYDANILVLKFLCQLNDNFKETDMRFYIKETTRELVNPALANLQDYQNMLPYIKTLKADSCINVFFMEGLGGILSQGEFLDLENNFVFFLLPFIVHEPDEKQFYGDMFGHLFSLYHTYRGWTTAPFFQFTPGQPLDTTLLWSPVEYQNGRNCRIAGDFICDTPPDYGFGLTLGHMDCSPYDGGVLDPAGVLVDPMEDNTMGSFPNCTEYRFTEQQKAQMMNDYWSFEKSTLHTNFISSDTLGLDSIPYQISPANNSTTTYADSIWLEWEEVPGAAYYVIDILNGTDYLSFEPRFLLTGRAPNSFVTWRVHAFNQLGCGDVVSSYTTFKTGTMSVSTNEAAIETDLKLFPNPVRRGAEMTLICQSKQNFQSEISFSDVLGRQVKKEIHIIHSGENRLPIGTAGIPEGLYFLKMRDGQNRLLISKKVFITK